VVVEECDCVEAVVVEELACEQDGVVAREDESRGARAAGSCAEGAEGIDLDQLDDPATGRQYGEAEVVAAAAAVVVVVDGKSYAANGSVKAWDATDARRPTMMSQWPDGAACCRAVLGPC
jgi:hypothetical protein